MPSFQEIPSIRWIQSLLCLVFYLEKGIAKVPCDPSDHLQQSPGPPGPGFFAKNQKGSFRSPQKSPRKIPENVKNTPKSSILGIFYCFRQSKTTEKTRILYRDRTLEKKGKRLQKQGIPRKREKHGIPKKQGKEGQGGFTVECLRNDSGATFQWNDSGFGPEVSLASQKIAIAEKSLRFQIAKY